ncbi:MAG: hypothetical protein KDB54_01505 [Solirubrobacterales bacterium]|nr:hypothetical protein [Solirubrobacterales bacterium]
MLIGATARDLFLSRDGGETWRSSPGSPGLLAWPRLDRLYLADPKGSIKLSTNQGRSWKPVGELPGSPAALGYGSGQLFASTHDGTILESHDEGSNWSVRFSQ